MIVRQWIKETEKWPRLLWRKFTVNDESKKRLYRMLAKNKGRFYDVETEVLE